MTSSPSARVCSRRTQRIRNAIATAGISLAGIAIAGCSSHVEAPPIAAVPMNPGENWEPHQAPPKPLPDSAYNNAGAPMPGFDDQPIVDQRLPEEKFFVDAYNRVRQPRIAVYVNRTLQGQTITPGGAPAAPAHVTYLRPGEYDEAAARSLDYLAMENLLADWLSCGGQVHIISPSYLASHLTAEDAQALAQGKPVVMSDLAEKIGADVLIQVQARPTRQSADGLSVLVVAEAMNVRGGESIGHAVVSIPLPIDKPQMNDYTRFVAQKLMDGMAGSWNAYASAPAGGAPPAAAPIAPQPSSPTIPPTEQSPRGVVPPPVLPGDNAPPNRSLPPVPPAAPQTVPGRTALPGVPPTPDHLPTITSADSSPAAARSLPPVPPMGSISDSPVAQPLIPNDPMPPTTPPEKPLPPGPPILPPQPPDVTPAPAPPSPPSLPPLPKPPTSRPNQPDPGADAG